MRVAVIGCGPAGMAAAHAAVGQGTTVTIYAPKQRTPQNGPLLIQRPIPGINTDHPDGTIHQLVVGGSILDYRYKLYGDINIGINGDILQPYYHAWKHRETYATLWGKYSRLIVDGKLFHNDIIELTGTHDLVVSTASAHALCMKKLGSGQHHFEFKAVAITPTASYPDQPYNTIIFNAGDQEPWVRSSNVFGVEVTEWPLDAAPASSRVIQKPISTNCDCYPSVLRTGRFGAWRNETWVDTAYWDTWGALESMKRKPELEGIK